MAVTTATEPGLAAAKGAARRTALVTGASSGIGAAFAERLARDGCDLVIVARRRDRLEALADRLRSDTGVQVEVLAADLTEPADLHEVVRAVEAGGGLAYLVNCAGAAGYMPFVSLPPARAEALVRLHIVAPTRLTRAALPAMIARGRGVVINVSSALAFSASAPAPPLPHRAVYAAAKSYLNTFTEILADELRDTGVHVQALCPGIVRTEFHAVAGYDVSHVPFALEAADVVAASLAAVRLGEVVCMPSLEDVALLADAEASRARLLDGARSASVARRYRDG